MKESEMKEIAEYLQCGMLAFYHRKTGKVLAHPDPLDPYFDPEPWQETLDELDENFDDYLQFVFMKSYEAFQVMENFANFLPEGSFKEALFRRLSQRRPFQNFKAMVESSSYRQQWYDFKGTAYVNFVEKQFVENTRQAD